MFNHSKSPNVSWTIDTATESIRYTTTKRISADEELCIFYGHKLWFDPVDAHDMPGELDETEDGWGGLSAVGDVLDPDAFDDLLHRFSDGNPDEIVPDDKLPFTRLKVIPEIEEEELETVHTSELF